MNIKIVRLITKEDLICNVVEETEDRVIVEKPMQLFIMPDEQRQSMMVGMSPWSPNFYSDEKKYPIKQEHVMVVMDPVEEIKAEYNEKHGSGLVVPSSKPSIVTLG